MDVYKAIEEISEYELAQAIETLQRHGGSYKWEEDTDIFVDVYQKDDVSWAMMVEGISLTEGGKDVRIDGRYVNYGGTDHCYSADLHVGDLTDILSLIPD